MPILQTPKLVCHIEKMLWLNAILRELRGSIMLPECISASHTIRGITCRCQPDAIKSGVRRKMSKSCIRHYFLWPCVRRAVRVWLCTPYCKALLPTPYYYSLFSAPYSILSPPAPFSICPLLLPVFILLLEISKSFLLFFYIKKKQDIFFAPPL